MKTHFDKLSVSTDVDTVMTYLSLQADMMPDKHSDKYKRMIKIVEIINRMKHYYDEVVDENLKFIDLMVENNTFTDEEIDRMKEINRDTPTNNRKSLYVEDVMEMKKILNQ
jgi:PBP1b-binding outer membrane lipoprotein LpoB